MPRALRVIPILRIFSVEKIHLSEHYGDGSPGASFQIDFVGVRELHAELEKKKYPYWRPGITETFWGTPRLVLLDPFGNKLCFCEPKSGEAPGASTLNS